MPKITRDPAPYAAQDAREVRTMLKGLEAHTARGNGNGKGKGDFSVKKNTFTLATGRSVDSWKMQDWDYKKADLPSYARGLFTYEQIDGAAAIAVRGYDKFFNSGEVRKTEWDNVRRHTRGPYELSVKENGCIVFMAGMDDDFLIVCSKHSTGARKDSNANHSIAGEKWVERHLAGVGKTKTELARALRAMNATAVAELCDDDFEEHVLAYAPEAAGLYLHGINLNLPEFATYPAHLVDRFAEEWGFKKTMHLVEDDIEKVKTFLEKVAETGSYAGRDTEGFVIRCQARETATSPWEDWFFKYKFEEPYLMYRQWRECTKTIISGKSPKVKKHRKITEEYLLYARKRFAQDPRLTAAYNQNHGIIALRGDFLKQRGTTGADIIRQEAKDGDVSAAAVSSDVVLVPIATLGCGKTTIALALVKLFGWGHVQNDNIQAPKRKMERFALEISQSLITHDVVVADKNNHQKRERKQLFDELGRLNPNCTYVAMHFVHEPRDFDSIRKVTQERVLGRGDNHQTIQADSRAPQEIIGIMEGFMGRFEPVDDESPPDDAFDLVVNLDPCASSRDNLETVVCKLYEQYPKLFKKDMPSASELDDAIEDAMTGYKVTVKHDVGASSAKNQKQQKQNKNKDKIQNRYDKPARGQDRPAQQRQLVENWRTGGAATNTETVKVQVREKPARVEFFCVRLPAARVLAALEDCFRDQPPETVRMFKQLQASRRVQHEFHVTLIHRAAQSTAPELWTELADLHARVAETCRGVAEPELGSCGVRLESVVWDDRIMCISARLMGGEKAVPEGERAVWRSANRMPHVTVGTARSDVKPKESNDLLARWARDGAANGSSGVKELAVKGDVVLDGIVKAVLSR